MIAQSGANRASRSVPLYAPGVAKPVAFLSGHTLTKGILPAHYPLFDLPEVTP